MSKICTKCGIEHPLERFVKDKRGPEGRGSSCRTCQNAIIAAWKARNKERIAIVAKVWRKRERPWAREVTKKWWRDHREKAVEYNRGYVARHRERVRKRRSEYSRKNTIPLAAKRKAYVANNREKVLAAKRVWRKANPEKTKESDRRGGKKWAAANPHKKREHCRRHFAAKRQAIPQWADRQAIDLIYAAAVKAARESGKPYHVDHIVPLQSPIVCGLHCEANLQVLPGSDNQSKGNKRWPDMP